MAEFDLDRGDLKVRLKFAQLGRLREAAQWTWRACWRACEPAAGGCHGCSGCCCCSAAAPAPIRMRGCTWSSRRLWARIMDRRLRARRRLLSLGDRVEKGQVICIVEAMKLMNEIEATRQARLSKCLVSNGQPIEFGQPLFAIRQS